MRHRLLSVVAVPALAVVALTGCTASGGFGAACDTGLSSGEVSSSVRLHADAKGAPFVTAAQAPIANPERSVLQRAADRDAVAAGGSLVGVNFAAFDSATGELLSATQTFGTDVAGEMLVLNQPENPLTQSLLCAAPGDTVVVALPAAMSGLPLSAEDASLVVLAEVKELQAGSASGKLRALPSGFPAVVTDDTGRPGVVLPPQDAPAADRAAVRIEGEGAVVTATDQVYGQVLTVGWSGEVLASSWDAAPESFGAETSGVGATPTADFRAALTGIPVGSQVVVISTVDGSPRVSVVDILAVL